MICPSCGAMHSAEAWANDPQARQCLKLTGELPHAVSIRCAGYLALFRPSATRGLAWAKALRLLSEVQDEINKPYIQWEGRVARPNSATAWAQAMERIIERPPKSLPLKSHGYLRSIAYEIADELDKAQEFRKRDPEKAPVFVGADMAATAVVYPETPERLSLTRDQMRAIREKNIKRRKQEP